MNDVLVMYCSYVVLNIVVVVMFSISFMLISRSSVAVCDIVSSDTDCQE